MFDGNWFRFCFLNRKVCGKREHRGFKDITVIHKVNHTDSANGYVSMSSATAHVLCIATLAFVKVDSHTIQ